MEKPSDLEAKYQKLTQEFSKVRSQAIVLKKAVLDEQAKNLELKETMKKHEQKIRKCDQEMESLTFRNEQLTKRISVLQQELQINSNTKKGKNKSTENIVQSNFSVLDEELEKKIMENAQLVSSMADKDLELEQFRERNEWLENKIEKLEKQLSENEIKYQEEINKLKKMKNESQKQLQQVNNNDITNHIAMNKTNEENEETKHWREEAEKWRLECELLRAKPKNDSDDQLTEYYESQLRELIEAKQLAQSETKTFSSENAALYSRLENLILDNRKLQNDLEKSNEELTLTTTNYKAQLDAMTEHLAAQNDKITKQCDEIQVLRHKISNKK